MDEFKSIVDKLPYENQQQVIRHAIKTIDPLDLVDYFYTIQLEELIENPIQIAKVRIIIMGLNIAYHSENHFDIEDGILRRSYEPNTNVFKVLDYMFSNNFAKKTLDYTHYQDDVDVPKLIEATENLIRWSNSILLNIDCPEYHSEAIEANKKHSIVIAKLARKVTITVDTEEADYDSDPKYDYELFFRMHESNMFVNMKHTCIYIYNTDDYEAFMQLPIQKFLKVTLKAFIGITNHEYFEYIKKIRSKYPNVTFDLQINFDDYDGKEVFDLHLRKGEISKISIDEHANKYYSQVNKLLNWNYYFKEMLCSPPPEPEKFFSGIQLPYLKDLTICLQICHTRELSYLPQTITKLRILYYECVNTGNWVPPLHLETMDLSLYGEKVPEAQVTFEEPILITGNIKETSLKHIATEVRFTDKASCEFYIVGGFPSSLKSFVVRNGSAYNPSYWRFGVDKVEPYYENIQFMLPHTLGKLIKNPPFVTKW